MSNVPPICKARTTARRVLDDELVRPPLARQLATGKPIIVFNIISSAQTAALNTGSRIDYRDNIYEIMNRETVTSPVLDYIKFNCVPVPISSDDGQTWKGASGAVSASNDIFISGAS